jgi:hypothetical protein
MADRWDGAYSMCDGNRVVSSGRVPGFVAEVKWGGVISFLCQLP